MGLFARQGFVNTTTRQIATEAGISTGLMYHYFDSKARLLQAVFDDYMVLISAPIEEVFGQYQPPVRLAQLLRRLFALLESNPEFWQLFYMMRTQPVIMDILGDDFRLWTVRLRELFVTEFQAMGRPEAEIEALLLYSLLEGTIQQYLLDPANYPLAAVVEKIITQYGSS